MRAASSRAAGQKVRVDVRFGDVRDLQVVLGGRAEVDVGVAIRIDDDRLADVRAADQITGLREQRFEESF